MKTKKIILSVFIAWMIMITVSLVVAQESQCDWAGTWDTNWDEMKLVQTGNQVTGTYEHDNGKIVGVVSGYTLTGTWSEAPSYNPPNDAGDVELTILPDCNSLTGKWRYGSTGGWDGDWSGNRVGPRPTPIPGFEAIFAIAGLLAVAYLLRRKKWNTGLPHNSKSQQK